MARVKPRIKLWVGGLWLCSGGGVEAVGKTPQCAYCRWDLLLAYNNTNRR